MIVNFQIKIDESWQSDKTNILQVVMDLGYVKFLSLFFFCMGFYANSFKFSWLQFSFHIQWVSISFNVGSSRLEVQWVLSNGILVYGIYQVCVLEQNFFKKFLKLYSWIVTPKQITIKSLTTLAVRISAIFQSIQNYVFITKIWKRKWICSLCGCLIVLAPQ